jgi:hypothetical protein
LDNDDEDGSDNDEFIVHQDGCEEIHIKRKAKKQLKMPVAHFKVIRHQSNQSNSLTQHPHQIDEQPFHEDNYDDDEDAVT